MELSAEQLTELLEGIGRAKPAAAAAGSDKRRGARLERRGALVIALVNASGEAAAAGEGAAAAGSPSPSLSVTMRDFSPHGIGLLINRKLPKGGQFVAKLTRPSGPPILLLYSVAHCRQLNANLYRVGAELACVLPEGTGQRLQNKQKEQARIRASIME